MMWLLKSSFGMPPELFALFSMLEQTMAVCMRRGCVTHPVSDVPSRAGVLFA